MTNEVLPSLACKPLTLTGPTLRALGYGSQTSSSTQAALPPQGVLQNGTRGVVRVHSPSISGASQTTVAGVSPSYTLPRTAVVGAADPGASDSFT
jgi:hypothetical protein